MLFYLLKSLANKAENNNVPQTSYILLYILYKKYLLYIRALLDRNHI